MINLVNKVVLVRKGRMYPLMIDPQLQGIREM